MDLTDKHYVFVCGLHRSGTSLLHRALRGHPAISGFAGTGAPEDEGQHLQTVFPPASRFGGPGSFCFAEGARLDETSPLVSPENRAKLLSEWERYWDADKKVRVEKSPPNLIRMRFLQAMFPGSRFVIIVRHPLAVGYATQKWSKIGIRELVEHWAAGHRIMLQDLPFIRQWRMLRYEDFVQNPRSVLDELCRFIGVKPVTPAEPVASDTNDKYFRRWEEESGADPVLAQRISLLHELPGRFGYGFMKPYVNQCLLPAASDSGMMERLFHA
ncbi:MAG: sulfotransferase [Pseudomonadota bacterium]|nr:sulfotransferase [Pseudomonadota bacterium]